MTQRHFINFDTGYHWRSFSHESESSGEWVEANRYHTSPSNLTVEAMLRDPSFVEVTEAEARVRDPQGQYVRPARLGPPQPRPEPTPVPQTVETVGQPTPTVRDTPPNRYFVPISPGSNALFEVNGLPNGARWLVDIDGLVCQRQAFDELRIYLDNSNYQELPVSEAFGLIVDAIRRQLNRGSVRVRYFVSNSDYRLLACSQSPAGSRWLVTYEGLPQTIANVSTRTLDEMTNNDTFSEASASQAADLVAQALRRHRALFPDNRTPIRPTTTPTGRPQRQAGGFADDPQPAPAQNANQPASRDVYVRTSAGDITAQPPLLDYDDCINMAENSAVLQELAHVMESMGLHHEITTFTRPHIHPALHARPVVAVPSPDNLNAMRSFDENADSRPADYAPCLMVVVPMDFLATRMMAIEDRCEDAGISVNITILGIDRTEKQVQLGIYL